MPRTAYAQSEGVQQTINPSDLHDTAIYRAEWERSHGGIHWKPSIHMARWASRITLEITGVRVERLQEISDDDALAEGCVSTAVVNETKDDYTGEYANEQYARLWDSLNSKRGYSWESNPWVWVIEFKRVDSEGAN